MSLSPQRVWPFRPLAVLVATSMLVAGGCYRAGPSGQSTPSTHDREVRFAGVDVVPTNRSGFLIRIHSGLVGDGEPLYVIDGVRMTIPPNRGIDWFKPEDIVDIKVLKLPHELAEYGPSGVNGVIVITTKLAVRQPQRR